MSEQGLGPPAMKVMGAICILSESDKGSKCRENLELKWLWVVQMIRLMGPYLGAFSGSIPENFC